MPGIQKYNDFIFLSVPVCREVNGVYEEMHKYKDVVKKIRDIEKRWIPQKSRLRLPRLTVLKEPAQVPPPPQGFREATAPSSAPVVITCVVPTVPSQAVSDGLRAIASHRKERARDVIPSRDWMSEFPELLEAWVKVGLRIRPISIVPMVENYVKETDWWRGMTVTSEEPINGKAQTEASTWALSLKGVLKEVDRSRRVLRDEDDIQLLDLLAALVFGDTNLATISTQRPWCESMGKEYVVFKGDRNANIFSLN